MTHTQDEIALTPLELIDRVAALIPPPRTHRYRYYDALAPNSPLRGAVTSMAIPAQQPLAHALATITVAAISPASEPPEPVPPERLPAHYLWAALIAHIYETFPPAPSAVGKCSSSRSSPAAPRSGKS
jgi:Putative transposase